MLMRAALLLAGLLLAPLATAGPAQAQQVPNPMARDAANAADVVTFKSLFATVPSATGTITVPEDENLAKAMNRFLVTRQDMNTIGAPSGRQTQAILAVESNNIGGPNFDGQVVGTFSGLSVKSPLNSSYDSYITGDWQFVYANVPAGAGKGVLTGSNPQVILADAATGPWRAIQAAEFDVSNRGAANAVVGINITKVGDDLNQGITKDSAVVITTHTTSSKWRRGIDFSNYGGAFPFSADATMMFAEAGTVAKGIDFSNVTITDKAFIWNNSFLSGDGSAAFVSLTGAPSAMFISAGAHESQIFVENQTAGQGANIYFREAGAAKYQLGKSATNQFAIYDIAHSSAPLLVDAAGKTLLGGSLGTVSIPAIPASGGGGGTYVCADSGGNLYRKATCP